MKTIKLKYFIHNFPANVQVNGFKYIVKDTYKCFRNKFNNKVKKIDLSFNTQSLVSLIAHT